MAVYKTKSALVTAMKRALVQATNNMAEKIERKVIEENENYYGDYYPIPYKRTDMMRKSPKRTQASLAGNGASAEVYINSDYEYPTGSWSGAEVLDSANKGLHGGKPLGSGNVRIWDNPMAESDAESYSMWAESLRAGGFNVK